MAGNMVGKVDVECLTFGKGWTDVGNTDDGGNNKNGGGKKNTRRAAALTGEKVQ